MTVMQLVLRGASTPEQVVDVVANPNALTAAQFESSTQHPLVLGPQEVLGIATQLTGEGFTPVTASLVDHTFTSLEGDDIDDLRTSLLAVLRTGDWDQVLDFYLADMTGVYVHSITLRDRRKGPGGAGVVEISQRGVLQVRSEVSETLKAPLTRAYRRWRDVA